MSRALRQLGRDWETLAATDPLWAILTDPGTRGGKWDADAFFESGRREVRLLLDRLDAAQRLSKGRETLLADGVALDFGCGVGRLTQGLCEHFRSVVGVDISPTMTRLADEHNRFGDRCRYVCNDAPDLVVLGDQRFDLAYSFIVLQHMPWAVATGYLTDMISRLNPGGLLVFQQPARRTDTSEHAAWRRAVRCVVPAWARRARHRLRGDRLASRMQMHVTPRDEVEAFLADAGVELLDVWPSHAAGAGYEAWQYVARKA